MVFYVFSFLVVSVAIVWSSMLFLLLKSDKKS